MAALWSKGAQGLDPKSTHPQPTSGHLGLHHEVVDLDGGVGPGAREADHVVLAVVQLLEDLADGEVPRAHVVECVHLSLHLRHGNSVLVLIKGERGVKRRL